MSVSSTVSPRGKSKEKYPFPSGKQRQKIQKRKN